MSAGRIRLVGLDMDGTLLTSDGRLTGRARRAIEGCLAAGCLVAPASGRPWGGLPKELLAIPGVDWAVTANGATLVDLKNGRVAERRWMRREDWFLARQLTEPFHRVIDLFLDGWGYSDARALAVAEQWAAPGMAGYVRASRRPVEDVAALAAGHEQIEKANLFFYPDAMPAGRQEAWRVLEACGRFEVSTSSFVGIELNAKGADKGAGLLGLAARLGIPAEQVMACGDNGNDLPMLRAAGLAVAMGNATAEAKAAADWVTDTNDADGVAKALEKFVLGRG